MDRPKRFRSRLVGLTAGVLLALLIWPSTGWLLRSHVRLAIPTAGRVAPWTSGMNAHAEHYRQESYREAAARQPDDYAIRYAASVATQLPPTFGADTKIRRLRELAKDYPGRADLRAAILRFSTQSVVMIKRAEEENWFRSEPVKFSQPAAGHPLNTPEQLAVFDRDAAEGERLDPANGYFPLMRAVGLFAAKRDDEALAAMRRAAGKSTYNEYTDTEVHAVWKLHAEAYGNTGMLPRLGVAWGILLPHLAQVRTAARVAVAKASKAEMAGRVGEGIDIRETVTGCGKLLRVHSKTAIGSLVGIAIENVSLLRPGGAPLPPAPKAMDHDSGEAARQAPERNLAAYIAFLRMAGRTDCVAAVEGELLARKRTQEIIRTNFSASSLSTQPQRLAGWWIGAQVVLHNALWMLGLGCLAALLARHRSIRTGIGWARGAHPTWALWLLLGALFGSAMFGAHVAASTGPMVEVMWSYVITSGALPSRASDTRFLISCVAGIIPLATVFALGGLSLLWRVPISVGVIRGLRGLAVPMACALLLLYAALVPVIVRQESALETAMERTLQHEGRYLAELAGKEWPE